MCPSGSSKYTAAAGIHPMTLGSSAGSPKNDSGWIPCARRRPGAASTSSRDIANAMCSRMPIGAEPIDHSPSIASPGPPIQWNAAPRSGTSKATGRPTTSR